jgi:hypothetical protein
MGGFKMFLSKKVDLNLYIFPTLPDGRISKEPSASLAFSVGFVLSVTREFGRFSLRFKPNFDGDFNGDGVKDLLIMGEEGALEIYYGKREGGLEKTPGWKIDLKIPPGIDEVESYIADLNRDGVSDLILRYLDLAARKNIIKVMLSKK